LLAQYHARTLEQLLAIVAGGNPDPHERGPVVLVINVWDGRTIVADYYHHSGPKYQNPDERTNYEYFPDPNQLRGLVERLLATGKSFVTQTGDDDMVCTLQWCITIPATD